MTQKELLAESLQELQMQLGRHRSLVDSLLAGEPLQVECGGCSCHHYQKLLSLISESVRVLDETRRSFKSKALEQLRLQLLQTLSDETRGAGLQR